MSLLLGVMLTCALDGSAADLEVMVVHEDLAVIRGQFSIDDGIVHLELGAERLPLATCMKILRNFEDSHRPVSNLVRLETGQLYPPEQLALIIDQLPPTFYLQDIIVAGQSRFEDVVEAVERKR